ncbi:MAG TPA: hypothetical protein VEB66_18415 [Opitutaceae bacterium]|nr:hypothetical protein [Opitutaceae bacterium]
MGAGHGRGRLPGASHLPGRTPNVTNTPAGTQTIAVYQSLSYASDATDADSSMVAHSFHWRDPEGRWNWENNGANGLTLSGPMDVWFGGDPSSSRTVTVTPTRTGTFQVKWSAADSGGRVESSTYNLVVEEAGPANPVVTIDPAGHQAVALNGTITYSSDATDADGDMTVHAFHWRDPEGRWNWENNGATGLTLRAPDRSATNGGKAAPT